MKLIYLNNNNKLYYQIEKGKKVKLELRNEEISVKKILAVINATYAVAKRKPERKTDQLPVGLLAQFVRALHRYRRGQGSNPGKPDFFRLSFRNCISCVNNCEDLLYT